LVFIVFAPGCGGGEVADDSSSSGGRGVASGGNASGGQTNDTSGGTTSGTGGSGLSTGSGGGTGSGEGDGDFFITAIIDGVERRMTTHLHGAVVPDLEPEQIALAAKDNPTAIQEIWQLQFQHVAGVQERAMVRYQDHDFTAQSAWSLHPVTLHLNATAPNVGDVIEGTFEGTFFTDSTIGATTEVSGGRFRVRRANPD
jgi:hypothetical protein